MSDFKVFKLLRSFSESELHVLDDFVRSPVFNKHREVIKLYGVFIKTLKMPGHSLVKTDIFRQVFDAEPKGADDWARLHHLNGYLLKTIESFLAWNEWNSHEIEKGLALSRAYTRKGLDESASRQLDKLHRLNKKDSYRHSGYFFAEYLMQTEGFSLLRREGRTQAFNLQEMGNNLDIAYCSEKLKTACIALSHQALVNTQYDMGLLEALMLYSRLGELLHLPAVAVYYHAFLALGNGENQEEHFRRLKALLVAHAGFFPGAERRDIYLLAINYCIRRINSGDRNWVGEVFELYQTGMENGAFLENGVLSRWTYNNIVIAGLKLGEYQWIYDFILRYRDFLPKNHRDGSFNFNLAKYYFEIGQFDKAMPLLLHIEYDDPLHVLGARIMLAKMYFLLRELDALDNLLDSMLIYLRRKKILGYHRENYINMTGLMRKLARLNTYDEKAVASLREKIEQTPVLTERQWLLEQLARLLITPEF